MFGINPEDLDHLEAMTEVLSHRGPDYGETLRDFPAGLGHRRLSIIDLSPNAHQPMANEEGNLHLVANGEVYNYKELRADLVAKGHKMRSESDCEVLLHLYEEEGLSFLEKVNGMFALIIWDPAQRRLVAAVDRFGKKPLYYAQRGARLALASEMKSLLLLPWVEREPDPDAIDRYLSLRQVPAPRTILKGVSKLEPAQMLVWEQERVRTRTYWQASAQDVPPDGEQLTNAFSDLMQDAVTCRLQSDVPLGLYLSGGVDSSLVGGLMTHHMSGRRISYTVGFDYEYDEHPKARRMAEYLGFEYNPVNVKPEDFGLMPRIAWHLDEPFGDLLGLPAYILARQAKKELTVVLTGDGADETMIGYLHQRVMLMREDWRPLLQLPPLPPALAAFLRVVPTGLLDKFFDYPDRLGSREKRKLVQAAGLLGRFGDFYQAFTSCFTEQDKRHLYDSSFAGRLAMEPLGAEIERRMDSWEDFSFPSRLSLLDLRYWIPFSVIYRLDKLNMAHAVETRSPMLDYRLVNMALNLPLSAKLGKRNKEMLRRLVDRRFPPALREKGKQAFYMPLTPQYRRAFFAWAWSMLERKAVENRGMFRWSPVADLLKLAQGGSMLATRQVVAMAMLEQWFRVYLDREKPWETPAI